MAITTAIGKIPGKVFNFSFNVYLLDGGPNLGFFLAHKIIINAYTIAENTPGKKPANNSAPTDSSTIIA